MELKCDREEDRRSLLDHIAWTAKDKTKCSDSPNWIFINMYPNCPLHWTASQLVVHEPLGVLPLAVSVVLVAAVPDDVRHDAEERQLLVELNECNSEAVVNFELRRNILTKKVFVPFSNLSLQILCKFYDLATFLFVAERPMYVKAILHQTWTIVFTAQAFELSLKANSSEPTECFKFRLVCKIWTIIFVTYEQYYKWIHRHRAMLPKYACHDPCMRHSFFGKWSFPVR